MIYIDYMDNSWVVIDDDYNVIKSFKTQDEAIDFAKVYAGEV